MNFGTPQEMYNEDKLLNQKEPKYNIYGCLFDVVFVISIILIFKYL